MWTYTTVAICVLAAGICLSAQGASSDNSLLSKATEIGTIDGAPFPNYWWLTDDKILYFEHVPHPISAAQRKKMGVPGDYAPGHYKAFTLDVASGRRAPFETFNMAAADTIDAHSMLMSYDGGPPSETKYSMPPCAMSPDHTWFVWKSRSAWYAARFDSARSQEWPSTSAVESVCWLSNQEWAEIGADYRGGNWVTTDATIHNLTTTAERKIVINQPENDLMGPTPQGNLLSIDYVNGMETPISTVRADDYDMTSNPAKISHYTISLPGEYQVWSVDMSAHGDRLAWVLGDENQCHIYISDTTGKGWTDLGEVAMSVHTDGTREQVSWPQGVRWLPGDKDISFVFDGKLYRIATPPASNG